MDENCNIYNKILKKKSSIVPQRCNVDKVKHLQLTYDAENTLSSFRALVPNRTACSDGNILFCSVPDISHYVCLLSTWMVVSTTEGMWNAPGKNTRVGCHSLLLGIFPTQESNQGLLPCRWILYHLRHQGSASII